MHQFKGSPLQVSKMVEATMDSPPQTPHKTSKQPTLPLDGVSPTQQDRYALHRASDRTLIASSIRDSSRAPAIGRCAEPNRAVSNMLGRHLCCSLCTTDHVWTVTLLKYIVCVRQRHAANVTKPWQSSETASFRQPRIHHCGRTAACREFVHPCHKGALIVLVPCQRLHLAYRVNFTRYSLPWLATQLVCYDGCTRSEPLQSNQTSFNRPSNICQWKSVCCVVNTPSCAL